MVGGLGRTMRGTFGPSVWGKVNGVGRPGGGERKVGAESEGGKGLEMLVWTGRWEGSTTLVF